jgi:hypothetical protein
VRYFVIVSPRIAEIQIYFPEVKMWTQEMPKKTWGFLFAYTYLLITIHSYWVPQERFLKVVFYNILNLKNEMKLNQIVSFGGFFIAYS